MEMNTGAAWLSAAGALGAGGAFAANADAAKIHKAAKPDTIFLIARSLVIVFRR
jgi:hypothetical protein